MSSACCQRRESFFLLDTRRPEAYGVTQAEADDLFRGVLNKLLYAALKYGELDRGECRRAVLCHQD